MVPYDEDVSCPVCCYYVLFRYPVVDCLLVKA